MELNTDWGTLAAAAGGRLLRGEKSLPVGSLCTDTRLLRGGEAFLALKGERFDAHGFLGDPRARTAGGWIVRAGALLPREMPAAVLEVPDTRAALSAIAAWHRGRFSLPVVGVTGSNGKTTTKEMLRSILERRGPVCANLANHNNEVGLPMSVLELRAEHAHAVFEMGASRRGDIAALCRVARPTAAVLTNVGPAHLEFFGDLETVLKTKSELVEALPPGGKAAVNADDPLLGRLLAPLGERAVTFGRAPGARVRVLDSRPGEALLALPQGRLSVVREGWGLVHRLDAAAAAAAALALGLGLEDIQEGLKAFQGAPLRLASADHPSGARLVVDAYNANPGSMRAGVETFLETSPGGPRVLVLGDMRELGPESGRFHRDLGVWLSRLEVDAVFLAGPCMAEARAGLREGGARFIVVSEDSAKSLLPALRPWLKPGANIYFKASRAMRLEELVEAL
jgi:UDP-N-acetylmuramoyl-tripeptide--D-alanyl-D-alanine ligase